MRRGGGRAPASAAGAALWSAAAGGCTDGVVIATVGEQAFNARDFEVLA